MPLREISGRRLSRGTLRRKRMRRARLALAVCAASALSLAGAQSAAAADYVSDQVIVKPRGGTSLERVRRCPLCSRVWAPSRASAPTSSACAATPGRLACAVALAARGVRRAQLHPAFAGHPNDPLYPQMYGLNNTGQTGGTARRRHRRPEGWDAKGLGGVPGQRRAARRHHRHGHRPSASGPRRQDRRLRAVARPRRPVRRIDPGRSACADDNDHGTHVAGTISANTNNGVGVATWRRTRRC